jgi:hypothetical protein
MDNVRFFGLALSMFVAVFFGMRWLLTPQPLHPDARLPTFQRIEPNSARAQLEASSISDDDATRDKLRHAVLDDAKALKDDPCNSALKEHYIEAANSAVPGHANLRQSGLAEARTLRTRLRHALGSSGA